MIEVQCQVCMLYFPPSVTSSENISNPFLFFPCGHGMCKKCIKKDAMLRDSTCPFCRRPKGTPIQLYIDFVTDDEEVEGKKTRDALVQLKENHDKLKVKNEKLMGQNGDYLNEIGRINQELKKKNQELGKKNQQIRNEKEMRTRVEKQRDDALEQCRKDRDSRQRLEQKVADLRAGMARLSRKNEGLETQLKNLSFDHTKKVTTEKDALWQLKESHVTLKVTNKRLMEQNNDYLNEIQGKNQE
ncbi:hypothetical protein BDQ17DRAFT_1074958 [Cyathus striatus]|nr:hypothetical protein BDQ17DRAFT_1074958 [Cyathus striatus]